MLAGNQNRYLEKELVLCTGFKWRVDIVAEQRAPMEKPARVWPLGTIRTHMTQNSWVL